MADRIRVRSYNVRFGDAILVTIPDRDAATGTTTPRHILVDFGNVLAGEGGNDAIFKPAIDNIISQLDGRPLDLYVMTHEHMDHVQGLFHVASEVYPNGEPLYDVVRHYAAYYGTMIRTRYGEPYFTTETVRVDDVVALQVPTF